MFSAELNNVKLGVIRTESLILYTQIVRCALNLIYSRTGVVSKTEFDCVFFFIYFRYCWNLNLSDWYTFLTNIPYVLDFLDKYLHFTVVIPKYIYKLVERYKVYSACANAANCVIWRSDFNKKKKKTRNWKLQFGVKQLLTLLFLAWSS